MKSSVFQVDSLSEERREGVWAAGGGRVPDQLSGTIKRANWLSVSWVRGYMAWCRFVPISCLTLVSTESPRLPSPTIALALCRVKRIPNPNALPQSFNWSSGDSRSVIGRPPLGWRQPSRPPTPPPTLTELCPEDAKPLPGSSSLDYHCLNSSEMYPSLVFSLPVYSPLCIPFILMASFTIHMLIISKSVYSIFIFYFLDSYISLLFRHLHLHFKDWTPFIVLKHIPK